MSSCSGSTGGGASGSGRSKLPSSFSPEEAAGSAEEESKALESSGKGQRGQVQDQRASSAHQWSQRDVHQARLKELRTSLLKHAQDTDWMYQPADMFIGKQ